MRVMMGQLILQHAGEALRHSVIVAVVLSTHTRCDAERDELLLIRDAKDGAEKLLKDGDYAMLVLLNRLGVGIQKST